ncbi:MAG TPA: response regulator transcription factor, partial [Gemmatimonadales bacterium]
LPLSDRSSKPFQECVATSPPTVVLVEDIGVLRDGMSPMLEARGIRVVATVQSNADTVGRVAHTAPDVVVVDAALDRGNRVALVRALRAACSKLRVVVMGLVPGLPDAASFACAGAAGLLVHDAAVDELVEAITVVGAGGCMMSRALTDGLFAYLATLDPLQLQQAPESSVTPREQQVADLIARGLSNKEIGGFLHIATHTVKSHVHSLLEKLRMRSRTQIAAGVSNGRRRWPRGKDLDRSSETVRSMTPGGDEPRLL